MTETPERTAIDDALAVIDTAIGQMTHRELVSSSELTDVLLDVRTLLTADRVDNVADDLGDVEETSSVN